MESGGGGGSEAHTLRVDRKGGKLSNLTRKKRKERFQTSL
jgi:hypothetical protein